MADPANTGPKATPRLLPSVSGGAGRSDQLFPSIGNRERCAPVVVGGTSPHHTLPDIGAVAGFQRGENRTSPLTSTSSSRASVHHSYPQIPVSPTKLPTIGKSNSISNLVALHTNVRRTASLPAEGMRADLCRSPSCPALWSCELTDDDDDNAPLDFRKDPLWSSAAGADDMYARRSREQTSTSDSPTKLPSIFGGSTVGSNRSVGGVMRRSSSLQSRLSSSLVDAPHIATTHHTPRASKREVASTKTSLQFPADIAAKDRHDVSPARRLHNPMLLPMREGRQRRTDSKKGGTTPGTLHASEGTSGDSGVSVGCRPSDRSDSSAAQDGSEQGGVWGAEVEVEIDDETVEGRIQESAPSPTKSAAATPTAKDTTPVTRKSDDHNRTALSAEKCREWLENVSEDGRSRTSSRDKKAFKMPKIN